MMFERQDAKDTDLTILAEIAQQASPWTQENFLVEWQNTLSHTWVIRLVSGEVVAFCTFWHVVDELHILNIATHTAHQRSGYARALLEALINYMQQQKCLHIFLEVRKGNLAAQKLYLSMGFVVVGERSRYYADNDEDAVLMSFFATT